MKEYIELCGKDFEIRRSARRKRVAVGIASQGAWFIGAPPYYSNKQLVKIISEEIDLPALIESLSVKIPAPRRWNDGDLMLFDGCQFPLSWSAEPYAPPLELRGGVFFIAERCRGGETEAFELWYCRQLVQSLRGLVPLWSKKLTVSPRKIAVKNVKTLWGSCSSKSSITFSSRLALTPPELLEYVIVHELLHLRHMNHSDVFWSEVGHHLPDYRERRAQLKRDGYLYNWRPQV